MGLESGFANPLPGKPPAPASPPVLSVPGVGLGLMGSASPSPRKLLEFRRLGAGETRGEVACSMDFQNLSRCLRASSSTSGELVELSSWPCDASER